MRIVDVGAGVVGVTTGYYLTRDGHPAAISDSRSAAEGASGVNAGLLVPDDSSVCGHLGWTHACGSARLLADLIAGREAQIASEP
jgi:glycine/D-amino acid oxidase-like deaminating enzyme